MSGLLHGLLQPFWMPTSSLSSLPLSNPSLMLKRLLTMFLGSITVFLQLFFAGLTVYVIINIVVRCLYRLPFSQAARRQLMITQKDHPTLPRRQLMEVWRTEVWSIVRLQSVICFQIVIEVMSNVTTKVYLFCYSIAFIILSKESREFNGYLKSDKHLWRPNTRPEPNSIICEKSVIFMRHG